MLNDTAVIAWLLNCPQINKEELHYNVVNAKSGAQGFAQAGHRRFKTDVCGGVAYEYSFKLTHVEGALALPIAALEQDFAAAKLAQKIADWIQENCAQLSGIIVDECTTQIECEELSDNKSELYPIAEYKINATIIYIEKE